MQRRHFLASGAALATASGLAPLPAFAQDGVNGLLDVHTHVFNDTDIPGWSFFWVCVLGWYESTSTYPRRDGREPRNTAAGMVALQVATLRKLRSVIPTAEAELDGGALSLEQTDGALIESFAGSLIELYRDGPGFVTRNAPGAEFLRDLRIEGGVDADAATKAVMAQIEEEFPNAAARMESLTFEGARALASDVRNAAAMSAQDERPKDFWGSIAAYFEFIRRLTAPRGQNIARLIELYKPVAGPVLFCPSLVDFSGWLNEEPQSTIEMQIAAMDKCQEEATEAVHMLAPFNPWRQMLWDKDRFGPSPLELVENAITKQGAIGVKVYPPMGFLPLGNADANPALEYQLRAAQFQPEFPALIDDALLRLYKLCIKLDAPVLAHASSGNGAGPDFGLRARPDAWRAVLNHPDLQTLRLCLAHFGGYAPQPESQPSVWELEAAKLIDDFAGRVFVDMAYIEVMLPGYDNTAEQEAAVQGLTEAATASSNVSTQLVYGSDWHMLAQVPGNGDYPAAARRHVDKTTLANEIQSIFVKNAVRLFALDAPNGAGYLRLKDYYANRPLLQTKFDRIEALSNV